VAGRSTRSLEGKDACWSAVLVWSLPGALLWLPTLVNAYIAAEILELSWARSRSLAGTALGELGPFMHITVISAPIAVAIAVGWAALLAMRARVPADPAVSRQRGAMTLAFINIIAPVLLWFGMKWFT
jgi:hypothetical protein